MSEIDVTVIQERKTQWEQVATELQTRESALTRELTDIHRQLAQISGAIQACDVFLTTAEVAPEVSPLTE